MKAENITKAITPEIAMGLAAAVVGLYLVYKVFKVGEKAAAAVGDAAAAAAPYVNPASQDNVVQQIGTAIVRAADQKNAQQGLTFSTWLVDKLNLGGVNEYDPNAPDVGYLNR